MAKRVLSDKEVLKLTNFFQEKMIGLLEEGAISQGQYELFVVTPIYHGFRADYPLCRRNRGRRGCY